MSCVNCFKNQLFDTRDYTVGYIMEGWDGVTILDRKFFLYQSGDSLCEELLQTYGYVNPWNIPKEHLGWIAYRWISVRTLYLQCNISQYD